MEVTMLSKRGLPEDAIISIRYGSVRRQAAISADKPFNFPQNASEADCVLKVDIMQNIGSGYIVMRPNQTESKQYEVVLDGDSAGMACDLEVKPGAGAPASESPEDAALAAKGKQDAKVYLESTGLLPFVQGVLQVVAKQQPKDPFAAMAKHFLTASDEAKPPAPGSPKVAPASQQGEPDNVDGGKSDTLEEFTSTVKSGAQAANSAPVVIIAGPPASGKGTQCDKIKEKFGYVHISTGDILRENVKNETELGQKAKPFMDAGQLVPSDLLVDLVKDRLQQPDVQEKGCLLDGFPRAPDQAKAMVDAKLKVDSFILIKVPDDTLVERGVGRRLDPETNTIYHMTFKPPPEDIVDRLVHRSDDHEEQIRTRLETFHSQVDGIVPYFQDKLVEVDGTAKPDDVFAVISASLEKS